MSTTWKMTYTPVDGGPERTRTGLSDEETRDAMHRLMTGQDPRPAVVEPRRDERIAA